MSPPRSLAEGSGRETRTVGMNTLGCKVYQCRTCGFIYDEAAGLPEDGIAPGTRWADLSDDWVCPSCGTPKSEFDLIEI